MIIEIQNFIAYIHNDKKAPINTEVSYQRDLYQMAEYLKANGITEVTDVTGDWIKRYVEALKEEGKAASTISRSLASMKAFYTYMLSQGKISLNPTFGVHSPKVERKVPEILTAEEIELLLNQPSEFTEKGIRDRAMLHLLYSTGIRVSELIGLTMDQVELSKSCICCEMNGRKRKIPFDKTTKAVLKNYLEHVRPHFIADEKDTHVFANCSGQSMSRQGFWKVIKQYAASAGIEKDITPHTFRHSFAANMLAQGAKVSDVQEMLGHSDISTTLVYANMNAKET